MPRCLRLQFVGAVYHVMSRGNRKLTVFEDDEDRRMFLSTLAKVVHRYALRVYAYCLMGNHYHLVCSTPLANLADAMRFLNGVFTQQSNRRHERTGHLFGGRYRSLLVQCEAYLRRACRYVVLNPVRADWVTDAASWPWSSYRATVGLAPAPAWLDTDWIVDTFGATSRVEGQEKFRTFVNRPAVKKFRIDPTAVALGSQPFVDAITAAAKARPANRELPYGWLTASRPPLHVLLDGVHKRSADRDRLIHLAHTGHGYRLSQIASALHIDPSTASKALSRLELRRPADVTTDC